MMPAEIQLPTLPPPSVLLDRMARQIYEAQALVRGLTARQQQVMVMMAAGKSSKQIARQLGLEIKTVERHRYALMVRLGVEKNTDVAVLAVKAGIV